MDIRIKATDYEMTPETQDYLDHRINSLAKLLTGFEDVARIEVEIGRDAGRPRHGANIWFAEMQVIVPGQDRVYARNNSESVNGAIDDVKEEVERQLRRERKIHIRLLRQTGAFGKRLLRFGRED
ncbi:MAG: HPF/RaiA family ribosome-associated protein [Patescibacteria group bacterium]